MLAPITTACSPIRFMVMLRRLRQLIRGQDGTGFGGTGAKGHKKVRPRLKPGGGLAVRHAKCIGFLV
jgi:hypothetical protein